MDEILEGNTPDERASRCLMLLRGGATELFYDTVLGRLLHEVVSGNLSLKDIGTNEEELKSLAPN